jgi:TolB protein
MVRYNSSLRSFELVETKSQSARQLTKSGVDLGQHVVWDVELSPDGTWLAAVLRQFPAPGGSSTAELRVFKVGDSGPGRLLHSWDSGPVPFISGWSSDHARIWVFVGAGNGASQIASIRISNGDLEVLKTMTWHITTQTPSLSPDGRFLVYHDADGQKAEPDIFILATDGSREMRLSNPAVDQNPVFAPDGSGFVFLSNRHGIQDLWFQPVSDGRPAGEPRVVFEDIGPVGTTHKFSDDGSLYYSFSATSWEVYTAGIDGSSAIVPRRIDPRPGEMNNSPAFSSNNQYVGYLRDAGQRLVLREPATGAEREFPSPRA